MRRAITLLLAAGCGARSELGVRSAPDASVAARDASQDGDASPAPCTTSSVAAETAIGALAQDDDYLYYACTYAPCDVARVPKAGGAARVYATNEKAWFVATDHDFVYWSSLTARAILRAPKLGGPVVTFASTSATVAPWGIAFDAQAVYFADDESSVWRVQYGGSLELLADHQPNAALVARDGPWVVWSTTNGIARAPATGGPTTTVAAQLNAYFVTTNGGTIYWTDAATGWIARTPVAGGETVTLATAKLPIWLATDATDVYWADLTGDVVARVPRAGGAVTELAHVKGPASVAVDARCFYYASTAGLARAPK